MNENSVREQTFSQLFHVTAEKYWQGREKNSGLIDEEGKAFLSSIGYIEDEFLAFVEGLRRCCPGFHLGISARRRSG